MVQAKAQIAQGKTQKIDIPERIGKYDIINEVGQGSTGRVFLSHDPYYGRDVAIKLYNIENEASCRGSSRSTPVRTGPRCCRIR